MIFGAFLKLLDKNNVSYTILRDAWKSNEVDILIDDKNYKKANMLIKKHFFYRLTYSGTNPGHRIYSLFIEAGQEVTIDFHLNDLSYDGVVYMSGKRFLEGRAGDASEEAALILHSIYDKGYFKKEYLQFLQDNMRKKPKNEFYDSLRIGLPSFVITKILESVSSNKQRSAWYAVARVAGLIKLSLQQRRPFSVARSKLYKLSYFYKNVVLNRSKIVSVVGSDGAGKTTTLNMLKDSLTDMGVPFNTHYFGWRHFEFPLIRLFYSTIGSTEQRTRTSIQSLNSTSRASSILKEFAITIVYGTEMLYRYILHLSFRRLRRRLTVTDRYVYDLVTFRLEHSGGLFLYLFPRPDILIYLHGKPSIIASRKEDETTTSISRKQTYFEKNLPRVPVYIHRVDTTRATSQCAHEILAISLGYTLPGESDD